MIIFILTVIIFLLFGLLLFGIFYKKKPLPIIINETTDAFNKSCLTQQVICSSNDDCKKYCVEAQEGEEIVCQPLKRYTSEQITNYGPNINVCTLAHPSSNCNEKYGGLKVWSGWSNPSRMEWDCLCSYSTYAGRQYCNLNADICKDGSFNWDVTTGKNPSYTDCECKDPNILMKTINNQKPLCVPKNIKSWYEDLAE